MNRPHAILSLIEAHDHLKKLYEQGVIDIDRWRAISQAIAKHSRLNEEYDRLTLNIVRDADRLDCLGLNGLKRCLEHTRSLGWPFYESGQEILVPRGEAIDKEKNKSGIGNIICARSYGNLLSFESAKNMAQPRLGVMDEFLVLFQKHQDMKDHDFWIEFIDRQIKKGKSSIQEEDFQEFLKEYHK